jgi:hypothetical protein
MRSLRSIVFALAAALAAPAFAADHRDGPLATNDVTADINDVYPFMNPNDPTEMIVAVTVVPIANSNSRFSDVVEYKLHVDNGAAGGTQVFTCTFPNDATRVSCRNASGSLSAEGPLNRTVTNGNLRIWAGLRDDPFFFDLDAFNRTRTAISPRFTNPGVNFFAGANTLTIVFGIKTAALTNNGANPTLKVYASTNRLGDVGISSGVSGAWYDIANPGHGLVLHVVDGGPAPAPDKLVTYWAVYDNTGAQLNLYGVGDLVPNASSVTVPLASHTGGAFPPASSSARVEQQFGTITLNFSNCNAGTMAVTPSRAGFPSTNVTLTRLTQVLDLPCSFLTTSGQIDRMGRPGINTALVDLLASTGKKDAYNRAVDPAGWAAAFTGEFTGNLTALDTLDGVSGNAVLPPATLAGVLVDDRLIINTSIATCNAYLAVELGVAGQCGGRTLARDVIDDTFGAVVGPGVSDFVANDSTFLTDFPFLAPPN